MRKKQLFNVVYTTIILASVGSMIYLGDWILKDWSQLDYTHNVKKDHDLAIHHRINLVGEGVGFFSSATILTLCLLGLNYNNK